MAQEFNIIGKRGVPRKDGFEKASGKAIYTRDIQLPGMLYARILKSPYANAKIKSMDTSKAEALPGVRAIMRYEDLEQENISGNLPVLGFPLGGPSWMLLGDRAHYEGETLGCIVAADSEDIAEEALNLVEIDWEELPFVLDEKEALEPGAPLVDERREDNLYMEEFGYGGPATCEEGDIKVGFAEADKIIEFDSTRTFNTHAGAEIVTAVAMWSGDHLEVWFHTQVPRMWAQWLATFFNMPMTQVTVHCPYQGCMMGSWNWCQSQYDALPILSTMLARKTGKSVKVLYDRRDEFSHGEMDCGQFHFKVGAKNDGTITAVEMESIFANYGLGPFEHLVENTKIKNISAKSKIAVVNKGHCAATRCEQNANSLALNLIFGHVSAALGLDATEVALKNDGCDGKAMADLADFRHEHGFSDRDSLKECIEKGKKAIDWDNKWHPPGTKKLPNGKMHGMGFIWDHEWGDARGATTTGLYFQPDGTVEVMTCQSDIGVNNRSAYCQIVADVLGMRYEDVAIKHKGHEDVGFWALDPGGSHALVDMAMSLSKVAETAKKRLLEQVTKPSEREGTWPTCNAWGKSYIVPPLFPGKKPEELDIKDSVIFEKANPDNKMTLRQVAEQSFWDAYDAPNFLFVWERGSLAMKIARVLGWVEGKGFPQEPEPPHRLVRQAHFMEVEVDTETGQVEVKKVVNVNDVGKAISPEGCEGQQYGGTYMAVGRALTEEVVWDRATGVMLNGNFYGYRYATMNDCGPIDTELVETGLGYGPWGTTGIGEDVGTTVPGLVGLAVYNAIGVWVDDYPITPDRVLKALGRA